MTNKIASIIGSPLLLSYNELAWHNFKNSMAPNVTIITQSFSMLKIDRRFLNFPRKERNSPTQRVFRADIDTGLRLTKSESRRRTPEDVKCNFTEMSQRYIGDNQYMNVDFNIQYPWKPKNNIIHYDSESFRVRIHVLYV